MKSKNWVLNTIIFVSLMYIITMLSQRSVLFAYISFIIPSIFISVHYDTEIKKMPLVIIFTSACILVGNLILVIFAIIPVFLLLVAQVLKELTTLNDAPKNEGYTFVYNIAANDYFMVSDDALTQYKNNTAFIIPN